MQAGQIRRVAGVDARWRPLIGGTLNGTPVKFIVDSGGVFSILYADGIERLELRQRTGKVRLIGVGGRVDSRIVKAQELQLDGLPTKIRDIEFLVLNTLSSPDVVGFIGQNILLSGDAEYDFANGVVRLFETTGCKDRLMAYWQNDGHVAVLDLQPTSRRQPHLISKAKLDGKTIKVTFDTGTSRSALNREFAERLGFSPDGPRVESGGSIRGIGRAMVESWIAPFGNLELDTEQIKNAKLRVAQMYMSEGADLVLGADFFLSHRIFVSLSQRKIYFTYNGGRVFDLSSRPATSATTDRSPLGSADAYKRRGAAALQRRELVQAIEDYTAAIRLDPSDGDAFYQRAEAQGRHGDETAAMADIEAALRLSPQHVRARLARGVARLRGRDFSGAQADFDALPETANDGSIQLAIAAAYTDAERHDEAIARLDRWISRHPRDDSTLEALNARCKARAAANTHLQEALADCNRAITRRRGSSAYYDSRGLVWLRLGKPKEAADDYYAALRLQPRSASSEYGLGLAKLWLGATDGTAHLERALSLLPSIADDFARMGLTPKSH